VCSTLYTVAGSSLSPDPGRVSSTVSKILSFSRNQVSTGLVKLGGSLTSSSFLILTSAKPSGLFLGTLNPPS